MPNSRIKMLTPERTALLLLAIVLMVWALVLFIGNNNHPSAVATVAEDTLQCDSTERVIITTDTTTSAKSKTKSKKSTKGKKAKKVKAPVRQRDHLNEPVQ